MRRGKIDNKSLIFLVIGSIFTFLSFAFDQLVIQTEDKIRDLNFEYEKAFNNYSSSKTILINTQELANRIRLKKIKYDFQADFLQKAIINIKFSPKVYDDYFRGGKGSKYNQDLETIFVARYLTMYLKVFNDSRKAYELVNGLPIRAMDKGKFPVDNEKIVKAMLNTDKLLNGNLNKFRPYALGLRVNSIKTLDDFIKMRKGFTDLLDNFVAAAQQINEINKVYGQFMDLYFKQSQYLVIEKAKSQNARNMFILLSVMFQILGLLFLVLLFKSLINLNKNEGNNPI